MNYRSFCQLSDHVLSWSAALPKNIDLVVGVPRSGLLPANLLALFRNVPLTDVEGLLEGRTIATGRRYSGAPKNPPKERLTVLVLDDSVWGGTTMRALKERIAAAELAYHIYYGAVYVRPGAEHYVDFYYEALDEPRIFEWNILQSRRLAAFCVNIDGVLCPEPSKQVKEDESRYEEFLTRAEPLYLPTQKVGWLVTCRSEQYRALTEEWLARYGVEYGELIMRDLPAAPSRNGADTCGSFKAEVYRQTQATLFFESSISQALQIANLALKPVFCVGTMQMIYHGTIPMDRHTAQSRAFPTIFQQRWAAAKRRLRHRAKLLRFR